MRDSFDGIRHILASDCTRLVAANSTPIEHAVGTAFVHLTAINNMWAVSNGQPAPMAIFMPQTGVAFEDIIADAPAKMTVWQQVKIGRYRADFLVRFNVKKDRLVWVAVECDGHDFHNITKEQAERDRARDRYFQEQGIAIFRFTGSEIWRSPVAVVLQVSDYCQKRSLA